MEIIAKVSKGSKMDQIYLPKNRFGLNPGSYVLVKETIPRDEGRLIFHNVKKIEKIKIIIIKELFNALNKYNFDNIIVTGSFLDNGFNFNDIDIILIRDQNINISKIKDELKEMGIESHLILIDNQSLLKGISTDPLFQTMLSNYISKKRFIYNIKPEIKYKLLDLHLLKSELLVGNFDILTENQKLDLLRNLVSIYLFITEKQIVTKEEVCKKIRGMFDEDIFDKLKSNALNKKEFIKRYKLIYGKTFKMILRGIRNESK
ncbi:MAG: hypothetical protein AABW45_02915 [Nanoarchaeota archaeon]